jgi:hypothetical protein
VAAKAINRVAEIDPNCAKHERRRDAMDDDVAWM